MLRVFGAYRTVYWSQGLPHFFCNWKNNIERKVRAIQVVLFFCVKQHSASFSNDKILRYNIQLYRARRNHQRPKRDVRNVFFKFLFSFCSILKKNSDSVRNEFGSVRLKNAVLFGYYSYLLLV